MSSISLSPRWRSSLAALPLLLSACAFQGDDDTSIDAPAVAELREDGRLLLAAEQVAAFGLETAPADTAASIPLAGLAAEALPPIDASARVVAPFAGVVTRVLADDGHDVRRGDALVRIQSRDWLAAEADQARARGEAEAASQQARRDALLFDEGIVPASRRDESRARAAAASAHQRQAEGALSGLRLVRDGMPGEYELLAPMDARVLRRAVLPGQAVEALQETFSLAVPGRLDVIFSVPVALRPQLAISQRVDLPHGQASVAAIGADTDSGSQRLRLRAQADGDPDLVAGQHFDVTLHLPAPDGAVSVPTAALLADARQTLLYVREADQTDGRATFRQVRTTRLGGSATQAVVADGLRQGEHVVVRGASALKPLFVAE